jgi:hypothetical protein
MFAGGTAGIRFEMKNLFPWELATMPAAGSFLNYVDLN